MKHRLAFLILTLWLAACGGPTVTPTATVVLATRASPSTPAFTATPTPTATRPSPPLMPTPTPPAPPPTLTLTPTPTSPPDDLWLGPNDLRVHPDGDAFYSGDLISFEVSAHHGYDWGTSSVPDVDVEIWHGSAGAGERIATGQIQFYGRADGDAWMEWVWDTSGLSGPQTVTVVLDPEDEIQTGDENPENNVISRTLVLRPADALPALWAEAHWVTQSSDCCVFHYISGTAAERDIDTLMQIADEAVAYAGERLGENTDQVRLEVFLIDRVLGHGGFASGVLILSYLDRFYPGGALPLVFRHEATHVLDQRFAEVHTPLLTEGLAVYISGGHFREEPLPERAAALLAPGRYIPLTELADNFYPSQHEIGYLEAGAFVAYLVDRFGWQAFKAFYGDLERNDGGHAAMIDAALQEHFGLSLKQAEADWLSTLWPLSATDEHIAELQLTVDFYDTLRRYQRAFDPSAYFLEAWLPAPEEALERGIAADFLRHPTNAVNVTLETMFIAADSAIDRARYTEAQDLLVAISTVLDAGGDLNAHPLAARYASLVQAVHNMDLEVQRIDLKEGLACVVASARDRTQIIALTFIRRSGTWWLLD